MAHAVTIIKTPKADSISPFDAMLTLLILNANDVTKAVDKAINTVNAQTSLSFHEKPMCVNPFLAIT